MEITHLYKHWDKHASHQTFVSPKVGLNLKLLDEILEFANERMSIWKKKYSGAKPPFTNDKILGNYRFCNIYRELDKQTITIHTNLLNIIDNFELWLLNLAFYRFIANPNTNQFIGNLSFDDENNKRVYSALIKHPSPKYGSAYVFPISIIQKSEFNTREKFLAFYLPKKIKQVTAIINQSQNESVFNLLGKVIKEFGFNFKFHWTEILIDVAYQFPDKINLFKEFPIGPGALPTIRSLADYAPEKVISYLSSLYFKEFDYLEINGKKIYLSAENWEGIACEFRKYTNLKNGKGRRRLFHT